ncbi:restriction endonuclease subunit S [Psychrobacter sp. ER1]|uniref:restriction endonuclease subunit S n=1 Tax=Psychrobacter sp. ER1 TaxID=3406645 RepID=UPI003B433299
MSKDISKPEQLITEHIDIWTSAILAKSTSGRGSSKKYELYGMKKLRKLILELAIRGKLVPQDTNDEPASVLLEKIAIERAQLIKEGKIREAKPVAKIKRDEDFLELPNNWELCRFGAITFNRDPERVPLSVEVRRNRQGSYDYYGASGVIDKIDDYLFEKPLLLIGEDGANLVNRSTPIAFIARGKYWVNNHAHVIDGINEDFLLYLCIHINAISLETYITGSAQPKMNQAKMNSILIALPPLEEQKRIIAKVDELMVLCDQLEQQTEDNIDAHATLVEVLLATLTDSTDADELAQNWARVAEHFDSLFITEQSIDALKQTVLQLAVMGKLVPQNPNDEPASVLLEKIAEEKEQLVKEKKIKKEKPLPSISDDEKPFELPQGWDWSKLGNCSANIHYGYTASANESLTDYRMLRITDIQNNTVNWENVPGCEITPKQAGNYLLADGDILIARTGGTVGKSYLVQNISVKSVFASYLIRVQKLDALYERYIKVFLESKSYWSQLYEAAMGTGQPNVNGNALKNLVFPVPPLAEQHRIVAKVDELIDICDQLKVKLQQSQETQVQLTDALVDRALG